MKTLENVRELLGTVGGLLYYRALGDGVRDSFTKEPHFTTEEDKAIRDALRAVEVARKELWKASNLLRPIDLGFIGE